MNEALAEWLHATLPRDVGYDDVANLCISLFCSLQALPPHLRAGEWSKENLAEAFALLSRLRFASDFGSSLWSYYGASFHSPTDVGHWIEVQLSTLKLARAPDHGRVAALLGQTNVT